jgi:hypothetical protein
MTKSDIGGVIGPEACAADRHAMTIAFAPGEIEYVAHDHVFVGVVRPHPIGRMNRFVVETFQIDGVRAIDGDLACIDIAAHRADQSEIFVLIITAERGWKQNQRKAAAVAEREHFKLAA